MFFSTKWHHQMLEIRSTQAWNLSRKLTQAEFLSLDFSRFFSVLRISRKLCTKGISKSYPRIKAHVFLYKMVSSDVRISVPKSLKLEPEADRCWNFDYCRFLCFAISRKSCTEVVGRSYPRIEAHVFLYKTASSDVRLRGAITWKIESEVDPC